MQLMQQVIVLLCLRGKCIKFNILLMYTMYVMYIADESDSDADVPRGKVLAAALHLVPGYFSCDCMWQTHFVLHPRLKSTGTSAPRTSISPGRHSHITSQDLFCWRNFHLFVGCGQFWTVKLHLCRLMFGTFLVLSKSFAFIFCYLKTYKVSCNIHYLVTVLSMCDCNCNIYYMYETVLKILQLTDKNISVISTPEEKFLLSVW